MFSIKSIKNLRKLIIQQRLEHRKTQNNKLMLSKLKSSKY